ncbi:MAG: cobalamin-dependent protein [Anaerolineaceae bacterium]|nr:cobalamin-dependent protein [Anaerolineaceae bacterium]
MNNEEIFATLKQAVLDGDDVVARTMAEEALKSGIDPLEIVHTSIQTAMDFIGDQYQAGEIYLPELVLAGDAAKVAMEVLLSKLDEMGANSARKGTIILGVVYGDNHDIGKNLVMAVLSANGFKVIDMGVNCHPKAFIETAIKEKADIIAMSTLITTSMPYQRQVIDTLKAMGKREEFYIVVGGGPITAEWTEKVGADGYGRDAKDAVILCTKLMESGIKPPFAKPMLENALVSK